MNGVGDAQGRAYANATDRSTSLIALPRGPAVVTTAAQSRTAVPLRCARCRRAVVRSDQALACPAADA